MLTAISRSTTLKLWFFAIRPLTLPLSAVPVLVGTILASISIPSLDWLLLLVTLVAAIAIQAATNLLNDAEDFERGNDTIERRGPPRVTAKGWASAGEVKTAAAVSFLLAALSGLYLVSVGGWPIFWIGVISIIAGSAYSAGPRPISHTPFGELFVFIFFGIVPVAGTYFLQAGVWSPLAFWSGAAFGSIAAAVLHTNNSRDIIEDAKAGRRTLAIVLASSGEDRREGARRSWLTLVYAALLLTPYVIFLVQILLVKSFAVNGMVWFIFLSLPGAGMAIHRFYEARTGAQSNRALVMTIRLQLIFATLFCFGLLV